MAAMGPPDGWEARDVNSPHLSEPISPILAIPHPLVPQRSLLPSTVDMLIYYPSPHSSPLGTLSHKAKSTPNPSPLLPLPLSSPTAFPTLLWASPEGFALAVWLDNVDAGHSADFIWEIPITGPLAMHSGSLPV